MNGFNDIAYLFELLQILYHFMVAIFSRNDKAWSGNLGSAWGKYLRVKVKPVFSHPSSAWVKYLKVK